MRVCACVCKRCVEVLMDSEMQNMTGKRTMIGELQ